MTFFRSSIRLAVAMATSAIFAISIGCGPDAAAPLGCKDHDRVPPPDDTVPYSEACCASGECAQVGASKGVCADFDDRGRLCTHACASDADCHGLGPEKCTSGKVCESSAAAAPSTSESN